MTLCSNEQAKKTLRKKKDYTTQANKNVSVLIKLKRR